MTMVYRWLKGDFGAFSGSVEFSPGLNTVIAGNESGKSTLSAMIRAMLYGVNTAERERADKLPDKHKYQPWSGRPMGGRLCLTHGGRDIVLSRSSLHGPMKDFSATYSDTTQPVPGLNGANAGELLCGMDAEVFEKTAFCSGESLSVKNSAALEAGIASAVGSGGDEASPSAADARLAAWQRERKNGKRGTIPALEAEISSLEAALEAIDSKNGDILALSAEIKTLRAKKLVLETELAASEDREKNREKALYLKEEYAAACAETDSFIRENRLEGDRGDRETVAAAENAIRIAQGLENDLRLAKTEIYKMKAAYASGQIPAELSVFEGCSPEYAVSVADKARKRYAALMSGGPKYWLFIIAAGLIAGGIAILTLLDPGLPGIRFPAYVCFAAALLMVVLGITGTVNAAKRKREAREMLGRWGCTRPEQFRDIARGYELFCRGRDSAKSEICAAETASEALEDKLIFRRKSAEDYIFRLGLSKTDPLRDAAVLLTKNGELERLRKKCEKAEASLMVYSEPGVASDEMLRPTLDRLNAALREKELALERTLGSQTALGDGDALRARLSAAKAELEKQQTELEAILAARELLARVGEEFSRDMTPRIAARAEELFTRLTHGRYGELELTRDMEASAVPAGEAVARRLLYLSRGAADQAWLAVRLALCETLSPPGEAVPLVLDDVFAMYDDARAETATELLAELAKTRQIILFTCRERDALLSQKHGGSVIRLS